ncbi:metacaspase-2 [Battus philenor]|uniref:metacaspase-2 n=1 Tax=Battus philenor TaxID=42288 RepID=UPI0035CF67B6
MKRTYKSKKDVGGLVVQDLISTIDAKSSVFDAFYIQNIKKTKRALSHDNNTQHNNKCSSATNRVRKKKYVRRIKKDASIAPSEPTRDFESDLGYLTPNKSLHVKKALDPFDLLLVSSPASVSSQFRSRKVTEKTYGRRKTKKIIEYNKSGNDSIDKENSKTECTNDFLCNTSNIKYHQLVIESENIGDTKRHDNSIINVMRQMHQLTDITKTTLLKNNNHILSETTNTLPLHAGNSLLSSTPYIEKHRSKSIYNLSPITMNSHTPKMSKYKPNTIDKNKMSDTHSEHKVNNDHSAEINQSYIQLNSTDRILTEHPPIHRNHSTECDSCNPVPTETYNGLLCTSEVIPFHGFGNTLFVNKNSTGISDVQEMISASLAECNSLSNLAHEASLRFANSQVVQTEHNSRVLTDLKSDFINNESLHKSDRSEHSQRTTEPSYDSSSDADEVRASLDSRSTISEYNTCSEDELSVATEANVHMHPVVVLEKLNDSVFEKYYVKETSIEIDHLHENSSKFVDRDNSDTCTEESVNHIDELHKFCSGHCSDNDAVDNYVSPMESMQLQHTEILESNDPKEDQFVGFVTTRRRNVGSNNSIINISDSSNDSICTYDMDKSVISNNIEDLPDGNKVHSITAEKELQVEEKVWDSNVCTDDTVFEAVENANHSRVYTDSTTNKVNGPVIKKCSAFKKETEPTAAGCVSASEVKLPVVLLPGKKWERSLSIFKRMTTISDSFDYSVLDQENIECKGRRYRQSVIATMEMQKLQSSLHNDTITDRRSTFVCKPSRSTIKIIKENSNSRSTLCTETIHENFKGFVSDDCDDTLIDLSKLSIEEPACEPCVLEQLHEADRSAAARDLVLRRCNQGDVILFGECYLDSELKNCHKIGEGVYGEVFLWRARDGRARVLKVIPIAGDIKVNGEPQKAYHEIISEIVIAMELSALRAPIAEIEKRLDEGKDTDSFDLHTVENATDVFNEVLAVRCVRGRYPSRLLELWELYDECKGSDNDNPAALPARQHYLVLELSNAGQDLESYCFSSAEQAYAIFLQLACALGAAEEALQFEHRDLHWGNVLVAPTERPFATFVVRGRVVRVARRGVACSIIDYSLSRLTHAGTVYHCDLAADDTLFDAVGDHQFDVYRLMRDRLGNEWKKYEPYTNVLWLDYVADKMITSLRYKRTNTKIHKHYLARLAAIKNRILEYDSAAHFVLADNEF